MDKKYDDFIKVTQILNKKGITPVLYGSLGLYKIIGELGPISDIDLLIPKVWLEEKWNEFQTYLESFGFIMVDLHEHEFSHPDITGNVAFGSIEETKEYSGLDITKLNLTNVKESNYLTLSAEQYLNTYKESLKDGYRQQKKEKADQLKIKALENYLISL